ncbi:hypothetical protein HK104_009704 [Borealophlyctis nickersoniae]|nr:hypothetical protein HK104_009704 [Borealophlyctis nickersoniae]
MHERVAKSIRQAHPDALIYFEGATWDIVSKAPSVPGGEAYADRSVISYHHYRPPQRVDVDTVMQRRIADATRLGGCGLFMTESPMWYGDGNEERLTEMWNTVEAADRHLQNWMGWAYKSFAQGKGSTDGSLFDDETGNRRRVYEEMWSRTFARAVSGQVLGMRFDRATANFELVFKVDKAAIGVTEIGLSPTIWYPNGYSVSIRPEGVASWRAEKEHSLIVETKPDVMQGTEITVLIERNKIA